MDTIVASKAADYFQRQQLPLFRFIQIMKN